MGEQGLVKSIKQKVPGKLLSLFSIFYDGHKTIICTANIIRRSGPLSLLISVCTEIAANSANIIRRSGPLSLLVNVCTEIAANSANIIRRSGPLSLRRAVRPGFSGATMSRTGSHPRRPCSPRARRVSFASPEKRASGSVFHPRHLRPPRTADACERQARKTLQPTRRSTDLRIRNCIRIGPSFQGLQKQVLIRVPVLLRGRRRFSGLQSRRQAGCGGGRAMNAGRRRRCLALAKKM
jgi:hypothetical protein